MSRTILTLLVVLGSTLPAQVVLTTDPYGHAGAYQNKHVVKDAQDNLYVLSVADDGTGNRPLLLQVSTDNGTSWVPVQVTLNDGPSGLNPPNATNQCCMAIDSQGILHIVWGNYYYPSYFQQYYRQYDTNTGGTSQIVNLSGVTGASTTSRTSAMDIEVDQNDTVWIAGHGTSSWITRLLYSNQPGAADLTFSDAGAISMSASAQTARLAVDAAGEVHCAYYRNLAPGQYWHRVYTPGTGWNPSTEIGNGTAAPHDYIGQLAADLLGNVHAVIGVDVGTPAGTWMFQYRKWDAMNGWSQPMNVFSVTQAQYTGVANYRIFNVACDEATGKVTVVYRDIAQGGQLRLAEKDLAASAFTNLPDLTVPSLAQHDYYVPAFRGELHPAFNRTGTTLDITWRQNPPPGPYQLMYQRIGGTTMPGVSLSLSAPAAIGTVTSVDLSSPNDPSSPYACGFALGDTPGIPLGGGLVIPLNYDALLIFSLDPSNPVLFNQYGTLGTNGTASVTMAIPNFSSLVGVTIFGAFVVADPMGPSGVGTISPSLPITFQ